MPHPRWISISPSAFQWEAEALDWLSERLPTAEPWQAWSNFEFVASDDGVAIRVLGEIDLASAPLLDAAFGGVDGQGTIEVDVSEMTFCDGSGLRVLERAHRRFGSRLRVAGATPLLRRLADLVDMDWLAVDGTRPAHRAADGSS